MLRETVQTKVPDGAPVVTPPPKPPTHEELVEERLDMIVHFLQRHDRRERWRSVGASVRSIIALLPFIAFLGSLWYVWAHGEDIMTQITANAARQASEYSQDSMGRFIDQFRDYLPGMSQGSSSSMRTRN